MNTIKVGVFFTVVLLLLVITPAGPAQAQSNVQNDAKTTESQKELKKSMDQAQKDLTSQEKHPDNASHLYKLANRYYSKGDYKQAEPLYQQALAIQEKVLGPDHLDVATTLNKLGLLYYHLEDYKKTEPLYQRALAIREKVLGPDHPKVANTLNNLGSLYKSMRIYQKAEPLYQRALVIREKALGPNHPDVVSTLKGLGSLYESMEAYQKAEPLYRRVLTILEKNLGPDHPKVASFLNVLALLYESMKAYQKAEPLYQRVLTILEENLGPNHPRIVPTLKRLGSLYKSMGNCQRAEPLFQRVLTIQEKDLGPDHLTVAFSLNNLGIIYDCMGDYYLAELAFQRSLEIREKALGSKHKDVARSINNLGLTYYKMGDYQKAESFYQRALAILERVQQPDHADIATCMNNLARLYFTMGDFQQAELLFQQVLAIRKGTLEWSNKTIAMSLNDMASLYFAMGDYQQAELLFKQVLANLEKSLKPDHPNIAFCLNNLAGIYVTFGDYQQAESLFQRALAILEKDLGPYHPIVAKPLNNLGYLYYRMGDNQRAEAFFQRSLAILEKKLGNNHPDIAITQQNLAGIYFSKGDIKQAEMLYQRALIVFEKTLGPDHPNIASPLNNLAMLNYYLGDYQHARSLVQRALLIATQPRNPEIIWRNQFIMAELLRKEGQEDAAIFFGKLAVDSIQRVRRQITSMKTGLQTAFLVKKEFAYKNLAYLLISQERLFEAQLDLDMLKEEEFFDFIRRDTTIKDPRKTNMVFTTFEKKHRDNLHEIEGKLAAIAQEKNELMRRKTLGLSPQEKIRLEALIKVDDQVRILYNNSIKEIIEYFDKNRDQKVVRFDDNDLKTLKSMQGTLRELGPGSVILYYIMVEDILHILLTTPDTQLSFKIHISAKELNAELLTFLHNINKFDKDPLPQCQKLYDLVFRKIDKELQNINAKTLIVSLNGAFRYLPLAALHDGKKYLVEHYGIVVLTAASKDKLKDIPKTNIHVAGLGVTEGSEDFEPLPAVGEELESIIKKEGEDDPDGILPGVIYLDERFTPQILTDVLYQGFPVIHIASHYKFDPVNEKTCFLLLGHGKKLFLGDLRDGDYPFHDVDLLTLSACNTATSGIEATGREIDGLGALAQFQGAKAVLATLWPVADQSTGLLMYNFYRIHHENPTLTKIEALRQAQLLHLHGKVKPSDQDPHKDYSHPFYWAPFILMGNWL